jgi:hypothetical protein
MGKRKTESYVSCALCRCGMLVKERNGEAHNVLCGMLFLPFRGSLVYFPCIRVAPLCAFY